MTKRSFLPFAFAACLTLLVSPAALSAKDSLGVFSEWGSFRDQNVPRCYAIAKPQPPIRKKDIERIEYDAFASVGTWPQRKIRNQIHLRLSRKMARNASITLNVGGKRFALNGGGGDAWAKDKAMDASIVAAMRSATSMAVTSTDTRGNRFFDRYVLKGAATAIDAATLGCAGR